MQDVIEKSAEVIYRELMKRVSRPVPTKKYALQCGVIGAAFGGPIGASIGWQIGSAIGESFPK